MAQGTAYDVVIEGGTLHASDRSVRADVAILGETIAAVGTPGAFAGRGKLRIDAAGMDVIPGAIDVHVHLALPFCGTVSCDDFESGSRAAASGCVTSLIDFAIPQKGQTLADAHEAWHAKSRGKSIVDYSWHLALTDRSHIAEIPAMVARGLPTFKEFMIYEAEGWNSDDAMLYATLEAVAGLGGGAMLLLHAESPKILDLFVGRAHTKEKMRELGARLHAMTRPAVVEVEAIERAIRFCRATGGKLYIVHMSTGEGAELVRRARGEGVAVLAETCAQYLCLDESVFERADGHLFACCPQVKTRGDIERLWRGARDGEVCVVSTDTCSFTREQKGMWLGDFTKIPMGLPGLDTLVPILYTLGVVGGRLSMNRLVELVCENPARVMGWGARKGAIMPGYDADVAIIDPTRRVRVEAGGLQSRCDWSPYEGMELGGFARTTLVRGRVVVEEHRVVGNPGHGRFQERRSPGNPRNG